MSSDTTTIAELHAIIQLAFGWRDDYLHQFLIYGICYIGGTSFADDPHTVRLVDFRFRVGERSFYAYNFYVPWRHELRLEQILPATPGQRYPVCIGGARAAPPAECAGPSAFLALRQEHDYSAAHAACPGCSAPRRSKGQHQIVVRSLFGTLRLGTAHASRPVPVSQPSYRGVAARWQSGCRNGQRRSDAIWRRSGPPCSRLRLERELSEEQAFFVDGCQRDWDRLPPPDGPLTVGIDGGYVHARDGDNRKAGWFELIVGKSVPSESPAKCFESFA